MTTPAELSRVQSLVSVLDDHVRELRAYCSSAASVLSHIEYEATAQQFEDLLVPTRAARERADAVLAGTDLDGLGCAPGLEEAIRAVDAVVPTFRRYAEAKPACEYSAARVAEGVTQGRSKLAAVADQASATAWAHDLTSAASELNRAAELARARSWWGALLTVENAAEKVDQILVEIEASVAAGVPVVTASAHPQKGALEVKVAGLRAQGQRVVSTLSSRAPLIPGPEYSRHEQSLREVAGLLSQAGGYLNSVTLDPNQVGGLLERAETLLNTVDRAVSVESPS